MKVKDLIEQLQEIENKDKYIHLVCNHTNGADEGFDIIFENLEVWNDGDESITIFLSMDNPYIKPTPIEKLILKHSNNN